MIVDKVALIRTIIAQEGGWKFTSYDVPTYGGMTYKAFSEWSTKNGFGIPSEESFVAIAQIKDDGDIGLRSILREQIMQAYDDMFFQPWHFEIWPPQYGALALPCMSAGVNIGIKTAIKLLQRCSATADDGVMGRNTLYAIAARQPAQLLKDFLSNWRQHYAQICIAQPAKLENLGGWLNRVESCYTISVPS